MMGHVVFYIVLTFFIFFKLILHLIIFSANSDQLLIFACSAILRAIKLTSDSMGKNDVIAQ